MPNVVRFTLSTARDLNVPGAGFFHAGVLDIDANDLKLLARTRYLIDPYGAVEVGIVDSATPKPALPAVPAAPAADPYPQYVTDADIANPASAPMVALRAAFAPSDLALLARRELDVWDGFDGAASSTTQAGWNAATYAGWIAGIDALLAAPITAGTVVRADLGASSNASRHVYAYTAGPANAPHLLLIGGMHGDEVLSQRSAMRWFEQFAMGSHPMMRTLRSLVRVTWIPTLNPAGYLSARANANGVNLARNFDFYWRYWTPPAELPGEKGTAAFSEPESQMVRTLCDTYKISALIDCHTTKSPASLRNAMEWVSPSAWIHGPRDLGFAAGTLWDQTYNIDNIPVREMTEYGAYHSAPLGTSWAVANLQYTKLRRNAAAVSVETPEEWRGSTTTNMSRAAIQGYCGYLTLWITEWLNTGQRPRPVPSYTWYANRLSWDSGTTDTVSMTAGGTLFNTAAGTNQFVRFDRYDGPWTAPRDYIDLPMPAPGIFEVRFDGSLERGSGGTLGGRFDVVPYWGVSPATALAAEGGTSCTVPDVVGQRASFAGSYRVGSQAVGSDLYRLRINFIRSTGDAPVYLRRCRVWVRHIPIEVGQEYMPVPYVAVP